MFAFFAIFIIGSSSWIIFKFEYSKKELNWTKVTNLCNFVEQFFS